VATIQTSIELYDGVSPVLRDMGYALERFSGQMTDFGADMAAITPDTAGIALFSAALGGLKGYAIGTHMALDTVLTASQSVITAFDHMGEEIDSTFQGIGQTASDLGARLPQYFAGPLIEIAGMFAAMAQSAIASLNSIANSACVALHATQAAASAAVTLQATQAVGAVAVSQSPVLLSNSSAGVSTTNFAMPNSTELSLPAPQVYLSSSSHTIAPPATVSVTVQNENYINSEVDAEAVLREMEHRLVDAVASSMEGVYA